MPIQMRGKDETILRDTRQMTAIRLLLFIALAPACGDKKSSQKNSGPRPSADETGDGDESSTGSGSGTGAETGTGAGTGAGTTISPTATGIGTGTTTAATGTGTASGTGTAPELVTIYRLRSRDHLYSASNSEGTNLGYTYEGPAFQLLKIGTSNPNAIALMRCRSPAAHFLSASPTCEGQGIDGPLGLGLKTPLPGTVPLTRCRSSNASDYIAVTDTSECVRAQYVNENVFIHVPTAAFRN